MIGSCSALLLLGAVSISRLPAQSVDAAQVAAQVAAPSGEIATIKPSDASAAHGTFFRVQGHHVIAANADLFDLISFAYRIHAKQIVNAPRWIEKDKFDIDAIFDGEGRPSREQQSQLFQELLAQRFHLTFHHEDKELPVYALTVDKGGPKLAPTDRQLADRSNFSYTNDVVLTLKNESMPSFADGMQATFLERPVVDQTGLAGRYDFVLRWTPDESSARDDPNAPPGLFTAIREQLGLKLEPTKAKAKAFVIDHVEKPSPN